MRFGENAKVTFRANARLVSFVDVRLTFVLRDTKVTFEANARLVSFIDARVRFVLRDARLMFIL